jgi:hypothetical protein
MRMREPRIGQEPYVTIRTDVWDDGMARLALLPERTRRPLQRIIAHVEAGWVHVARLQLLFEVNRGIARDKSLEGQVLNFIDSEITDLFRGLAWDAVWLIPGASGPPPRQGRAFYPDSEELSGDADFFARCLTMLHLAGHSTQLSEPLRREILSATVPLMDWSDRFYTLAEPLVPE